MTIDSSIASQNATQQQGEYTSSLYWKGIWANTDIGKLWTWNNDPAVRQIAELILDLIAENRSTPLRILEVGCANSFWLPFFAQKIGSEVYGLDYASFGCAQAVMQLERRNVNGHIWCEDFFAFAEHADEKFDLIISFGFIEHFEDPSKPLAAMQKLLRSGGSIFADIPNLKGIYGWIMKRLNKDIYDLHNLMDNHDLELYANKAGLVDIMSGYTGGILYFSVLNLSSGKTKIGRYIGMQAAKVLRGIDIMIGRTLELFGLNINTRIASPYVYITGKKPSRK